MTQLQLDVGRALSGWGSAGSFTPPPPSSNALQETTTLVVLTETTTGTELTETP